MAYNRIADFVNFSDLKILCDLLNFNIICRNIEVNEGGAFTIKPSIIAPDNAHITAATTVIIFPMIELSENLIKK